MAHHEGTLGHHGSWALLTTMPSARPESTRTYGRVGSRSARTFPDRQEAAGRVLSVDTGLDGMTGQAHLALAGWQPVDADFAELVRLLASLAR
ncbi:MAG: hypothetical protein WBF34_31235 [Streptosporangiaceae bacterium]|jgi:hypothetical protein